MLDWDSLLQKYYVTIGIECHVQLKTKTKLFAGVDNDARTAAPNSLISHICVGMPGALPVLNEAAVRLASKAGFALETRPQPFSKFDRKHYFYPDLPLGYQITQFEEPIVLGGNVTIRLADGTQKVVGVTRAHLESDAGKNTHPAGADYSLVDLNRAGTPLLEIVSEPDMHSPEEAKAYAKELYLLMKYADVSDVDLYHGNMRFDVNVSVSADRNVLGTRAEIKNLNSFRSVEKASEYEIRRQIEIIERGGVIVQETRGWNEAKQVTLTQRSKEDAHDYRYFPDPDLPPIRLSEDYIAEVAASMPKLPNYYRAMLEQLGLGTSEVETLLSDPATVQLIDQIAQHEGNEHAKRIAVLFLHAVVKLWKDSKEGEQAVALSTTALSAEPFIELSKMVGSNTLSSTAAKEIFWDMLQTGKGPAELAKEKDLLQVSDSGELEKIVDAVLAANPQAAADVAAGEMKAIGFLVGQVMKQSAGKANPPMVQSIIRTKLGV
jgi:aspartyl-tRNA(Asn)/glutamyl-tRNA(Gln) amidotransferase subunit B